MRKKIPVCMTLSQRTVDEIQSLAEREDASKVSVVEASVHEKYERELKAKDGA